MSNKGKRFFGQKSVSILTAESLNLNDDDFYQGYSEEHPLVFSFPDPIDPSVHPTLATNWETHLSHRVSLNMAPWFGSRYLTINVEDVEGNTLDDVWMREAIVRARRSSYSSMCRIVFEYGGMIVWYLGDRCWRQIISVPFIPHPPPENMCTLGRASHWRHFLRNNEGLWPQGSMYLDLEGDYDSYWDRVFRGPILPPEIYRAANMDFVGHRGIRSDLRITHPAKPYASSQGPYEAFVQPPFDPKNQWSYDMITSQGMRVDMPIPHVDRSYLPTLVPDFDSLDEAAVRERYAESQLMMHGMRSSVMNTTDEYYHYMMAERQRSKN